MEFLNLISVELLPNAKASAAFTVDSSKVFKEQQDIPPVVIDEGLSYIPWGQTIKCLMKYSILLRATRHYPPVSSRHKGCSFTPCNRV